MRQTLKIFNEFGIKPTNNFVSAGSDFYVPYFDEDKKDVAFNAFKQSYKINDIDIDNVIVNVRHYLKTIRNIEVSDKQMYNIVHLYFALDSASINSYLNDVSGACKLFVTRYLIFDNSGKPGIRLELNDAILINSGIHTALNPGTAGIFFNKSGKGNAGFDVRAQVVDEDYTGLVHLSLAFTKDTESKSCEVYCGDKITQMVVLPVINCDYDEIDEDTYYKLMSSSQRGSDSFGSSDVKH